MDKNNLLIEKIIKQNQITIKQLGFEKIIESSQKILINKIVDVSVKNYKYIFKKNNNEIYYNKYLTYIDILTNEINLLFLQKIDLSLDDLYKIHKVIFSIFSDDEKKKLKITKVGEIRKEGRMVYNLDGNGKIKNKNYFISENKIKKQLLETIDFYNKNKDIYSIVVLFNKCLSNIHPFEDGNGRVFFLLLDILLLKNNYLPLFLNQDKVKYNEIIETYYIDRNFNKLITSFLELMLIKYSNYNIN